MKVALVHDYLTQKGGAERVFELLCEYFPKADVFTSVYDPQKTIDLRNRLVNTTALQVVPGAARYFRLFAPLYFTAFRALDLQDYDLIISSTSSFAKGVRKREDAKHICFCHNVTRFLWDTDTYLNGFHRYQTLKPILEIIFQRMRKQDLESAQEPDVYIANSSTVAKRIEEFYGRPAQVINYPIDDRQFLFSEAKDDYFLVSSRLLSYKKVDVIVEAFNRLQLPLIVIGQGPEADYLKSIANDNIQFLGHVSDEKRKHLMAHARTVVVAALEDYGLVPIEANVSGTPVISYGAGGVLDTQKPGFTGLFFEEQSADSLCAAVSRSLTMTWDNRAIRDHALRNFTPHAFFSAIDNLLEKQTDIDTKLMYGVNA